MGVGRPSSRKDVIEVKWAYKRKFNFNRLIQKCKAQLVIKGYFVALESTTMKHFLKLLDLTP